MIQAAAWYSSGSPNSITVASAGGGRIGTTCDRASPTKSAGTATTKPAIGPAAPMSNSIGLVGIRWRMRMKAPNVPVIAGAGRKYGFETSMP